MNFEKIYREANDRIHPDPTLVEKVLASSKKPAARKRLLLIPAVGLPAAAAAVCICIFFGQGQMPSKAGEAVTLQNSGKKNSSVVQTANDPLANPNNNGQNTQSSPAHTGGQGGSYESGMKGTASKTAGLKPGTVPGTSKPSLSPLAEVRYPVSGEITKLDAAFENGYRSFALKTTPKVLGQSGENSVYSPASFFMASSMLAECTAGETQKELLSLLGMEANTLGKGTAAFFANNYFDRGNDNMLKFANSYWIRKGTTLKQPLLNTLASRHYAEGYTVAFGTDPAVNLISQWLDLRTGRKLNTKLDSAKAPDTVLLLLNTVYLQGQWKMLFDSLPGTAAFTRADGQTVQASYMKCENLMGISQAKGLTLVDLPLLNGCVMRVALPEKGVSPQQVLSNQALLEQLCYGGTEEKLVKLKMPKFTMTSKHNLKEVYHGLGVKRIFDETTADFSPMSNARNIKLGYLSQQAYLAVDEEGCKATAFTEAGSVDTMAPSGNRTSITLDRSFLFAILRDGKPIFTGVVDNPAEQ